MTVVRREASRKDCPPVALGGSEAEGAEDAGFGALAVVAGVVGSIEDVDFEDIEWA